MNILLNGPIARQGLIMLRQAFPEASINQIERDMAAEEVLRAFEDAEVLITQEFSAELPPMPRLRLVHLPMIGLDRVDLDALPGGCPLCHVGEHETGISEYVMAAMLDLTIGLQALSARFKQGDWSAGAAMSGPFRPELAGKTLGCIGYGAIGQAVAKRARAFDMRIMAVTRRPRQFDPEPDWLGGLGMTEALTEAADFVLVACPLTDETRNLLGPRYLGAMKPSAFLINIARGPIVCESTLYAALKERRIAGAVIDVWYNYPSADQPHARPSRYPFHELDNVIMTPHCSGWTEGLVPRRFAIIIDNIRRLIEGRPLIGRANRQAG